ncbi:MAG: DUF423 domain-containing protein [Bacteroidota bacterium]
MTTHETPSTEPLVKRLVILASVMGTIGVVLGALGAHALTEHLSAKELGAFETGVRYHMYHTLALLALAALTGRVKAAGIRWTGNLFAVGTLLFSGSLYLLSTQKITGLALGILGPVTPIGGLLLIIGWAALLWSVLKSKS